MIRHATKRYGRKRSFLSEFWLQRNLFLMLLPGLAFFIVYKYLPIYGVSIAFKDYSVFLGMNKSPFVGLKHFIRFFNEPSFWVMFRNTMILAFFNLVVYFPMTIVVALLLSEVRHTRYKRFVQSVTYLPHFLSWVVISGLTYTILNSSTGALNLLLAEFGMEPTNFLLSKNAFRPIYIIQMVWRDAGWGAIVFLAALTSVDPQLYEAAHIEGANRMQRLWYITLPCIIGTVITVLILRLGNFLNLGFEQVILLQNSVNREVSEIFDTYVYTLGVQQAQFSYSTAVGLFKSIIGLILVVGADLLAKHYGEEGIL